MTLPAEILKEVLALRKENGLEATEEAVTSALKTVKYSLKEVPRYRRAGRSPIYLAGKFLTSKIVDPVTGEKDSNSATLEKANSVGAGKLAGKEKTDATQFYRVLHGRGFKIKITKDVLTEELETRLPESLEKLDLKFGDVPPNGEGIYVTQTSPKILVTLTLDKFIELTGLKP